MGTIILGSSEGLVLWQVEDVPTVPAAPSGLSATPFSSAQINLAWTDNASNEADFVVERAPDVAGSPGTFAEVATALGVNATVYSDTGLVAETKYHYRVKAVNGVGSSAYSNTASATTQAEIPSEFSVTHNFTAGKATFGQVVPRGAVPEGQAIKVGSLATQTDVKVRWDDGSIRQAVVTCNPTSTANLELVAASPASGTFTPTIPTASVVFTIGGTVWIATLPGEVSADLWLDGPLVREWRHAITPEDVLTGNLHAWLRVYFDTRAYSDGQSRIDIAVENCLDVSGATKVTYDVAITVGGSVVFSQSAVSHPYLSRWRKVFGVGLTESTTTFDFSPLYESKAATPYQSTITNLTYSTVGSTFSILGRGGNTYDNMGAAGGRPELVPYPDWTARYLAHQTASQREYTLANGTLAGSWPIHIRNADGSLPSIDAKPRFWLDKRGQGVNSGVPTGDQPKGDLTEASTGPFVYDTSHVPSLAYIPYLVTGDRYLADEVAFWGNIALIWSWWAPTRTVPVNQSFGGRGEAFGLVGTEQTRGRAWGLRNLVDAAAYLPDDNPAKSYFVAKVANNLDWYDMYAGVHVTPLGAMLEMPLYNSKPNVSVWMSNYLAWSLDHAVQQGFTGGTLMRDKLIAFQLQLFTSDPDYDRQQGAPYYLTVGDGPTAGPWNYFTTMAELYEENFGTSLDTTRTFVDYYGVDARMCLQIGARLGMDQAQETVDWLTPQIQSDLNNRCGWAFA